jgi:hypothetical protein
MAVLGGMVLAGFPGMMFGLHVVAVRHVSMMTGFVMVTGCVKLGGRPVVLGGLIVMFSGFVVMLHCFF